MITTCQTQVFIDGHLLLYIPNEPLSRFISHIWYVKDCNKQGKTIERFLPNGSIDLIINLIDEPEKVLGPGSSHQCLRRSWVTGVQREYTRIEAPANLSMIGVEFKPGGAYPFFGLPMSELGESSIELDCIWGPAAQNFRDSILECSTEEDRFHLVENMLLSRLEVCDDPQPAIDYSIQMILASSSGVPMRTVADHAGMDHKRFINRFENVAGVTPKLFSRICRFQRALCTLSGNGHVDLTTVAMSCEYFDQAHFIKEFKEFSGLTPGEYLQVKGPFPGWITDSKIAALR